MRKQIAIFEITLMIVMTFAVSYFAYESSGLFLGSGQESETIVFLREGFIEVFGGGLVSAQSSGSSSGTGLWTCPVDKNGAVCQEYPASTCQTNCNGVCFPGKREDFFECRLGTCIDSAEGTCAANSPQSSCVSSGGLWKAEAASELPECRPGCCLYNNQAQYVTERACSTIGRRVGLTPEFKFVENEIACLALAGASDEGACVLGDDGAGKKNCRFVTKSDCVVSGGEFHKGLLCSNPALNTNCEKQKTTKCVEGKDEVYWFDSCGNRENIFDSNLDKSFNTGRVLLKEQSCVLGVSGNLLQNQASCGNCNYLTGSICGVKRAGESVSVGDFVCRDLSCDDNGVKRKHGESWCAFDSAIGVYGQNGTNGERSVDVPGSRHYRKVCFNGDVRTEPCADGRQEVCSETRDETAEFSSAACRVNRWQVCLEANTDAEKLNKCEENSDCFLKTVNFGQFKFDRCVPKYPAGFDLNANFGGEVGESICSAATQKCTAIYQKGFGGWKCKANCGCVTGQFTETMNNLCISLGDCGGHTNLGGQFSSDGYSITGAPKLSQQYISALQAYKTPVAGQKVDPLTSAEIAAIFGIDASEPNVNLNSKLASAIGLVGAGAVGALYLYKIGVAGVSLSEAFSFSSLNHQFAAHTSAWGNALGAAAAGAAIGYLAVKLLGLKGEAALATVIAGALTGAALSLFTGLSFTYVLVWTFVIVFVIAFIFKLLGIGKTKKVVVDFKCKPWQPPRGGNACADCGKNGLPCSKYKCQSYGQTCEFVNEGTTEEACVNVAPNDAGPPVISPNSAVKSANILYSNINNRGFKITDVQGKCVPAFTQVQFGISLNERGQCKIDSVHTTNYDDMEFYFGESSLYKLNHTMAFVLPSLASIAGEEGLSINPNRTVDFNMYVRCMDRSGNKNIEEYNINFCLSPEADRTAPVITKFVPESPGYAAFNSVSANVQFFVSEPAECKWSLSDSDYDVMTNVASCNNDIEDGSVLGWSCNTNLSVTGETNRYYFRCKDQPALIENVSEGKIRNKNSQSFVYEVKKSVTALSIVSSSPNGTIKTGNLPVVVDLGVTTSGGATGTNRFCEFNMGAGFIRFFSSGTDTHTQRGLNLFEARAYNIPVRCKDDAGNSATANIAFTIEADRTAPLITRIYRSGNGFNVITNENAVCRHSFNGCNFRFENGTLMSGEGLVHTSGIEDGKTYSVKCRDVFENLGACINVKAGAF